MNNDLRTSMTEWKMTEKLMTEQLKSERLRTLNLYVSSYTQSLKQNKYATVLCIKSVWAVMLIYWISYFPKMHRNKRQRLQKGIFIQR